MRNNRMNDLNLWSVPSCKYSYSSSRKLGNLFILSNPLGNWLVMNNDQFLFEKNRSHSDCLTILLDSYYEYHNVKDLHNGQLSPTFHFVGPWWRGPQRAIAVKWATQSKGYKPPSTPFPQPCHTQEVVSSWHEHDPLKTLDL